MASGGIGASVAAVAAEASPGADSDGFADFADAATLAAGCDFSSGTDGTELHAARVATTKRAKTLADARDPSPQPSPTRGEGARKNTRCTSCTSPVTRSL